MTTRARALAAVLALVALGARAVPLPSEGLRPAVGRHQVQLCVATSASAPPSCGPAQADLRSNGSATVRVDDVVYHLALHSSQVEVVVMHNIVQIDEFVVPYDWVGSTLKFNDDDRHTRYEVRFPEAGR